MTRASIFGLGYVGSVTSACLAQRGAVVVGVDVVQRKVDMINAGESPVLEPGVDVLIRDAVDRGALSATVDPRAAAAATDVSIITVGTPSQPNGAIDLQFVQHACREIADVVNAKGSRHTIIIRSTVTPGFVRSIADEIGQEASSGANCEVLFVPEFLREGTALSDFQNPSTFIIGTEDGAPPKNAALSALFADEAPTVMTWENAEAVKYAFNAFHATKVVFANEIGRLGKRLGFDSRVVMQSLADDTVLNISPYYLKPGNPYGGSCLPKDVAALMSLAKRSEIDLPLMSALSESNRHHQELLTNLVTASGKKRVCLIGLSFKSNTDDLRNSPMVALAEHLLGKGYELALVDPHLNPERLVGTNKKMAFSALPHLEALMSSNPQEAISSSEVIVVALRCVPWDVLSGTVTKDHTVIDVNGWAELADLEGRYEGLCWS